MAGNISKNPGGDQAISKQKLLGKSQDRVSTDKEGLHAQSSGERGHVSSKINQGSRSFGNRFARLNEDAEGEDMDVEGVHVDEDEGAAEENDAPVGQGSFESKDKGKD